MGFRCHDLLVLAVSRGYKLEVGILIDVTFRALYLFHTRPHHSAVLGTLLLGRRWSILEHGRAGARLTSLRLE